MNDSEKTQPLQQECPPDLDEDLLVDVTGGVSSRNSGHRWSGSSGRPVPSNSGSSTSGSYASPSSGSSNGSSLLSDANSDFHIRYEPIDLNIPNWVPGATPAKRRRIL